MDDVGDSPSGATFCRAGGSNFDRTSAAVDDSDCNVDGDSAGCSAADPLGGDAVCKNGAAREETFRLLGLFDV